MVAFPTGEAAESSGCRSIGDGHDFGFECCSNSSYLNHGIKRDPSCIESIVVKKNGTGSKQVASSLYFLNPGRAMAATPMVAPSMLQGWLIPRLCGPFAGLEADGHACATHGH
ncbi:MAG: hypothetical protein EXQ71_10405 [Acidimicrobiia bacterium]|nr:hypothetical protein [Acidimicrobiia bacterium]